MTIKDYDNELLHMAHDLAVRLLPAFENTKTGIPYPRVSEHIGVVWRQFRSSSSSPILQLKFCAQFVQLGLLACTELHWNGVCAGTALSCGEMDGIKVALYV